MPAAADDDGDVDKHNVDGGSDGGDDGDGDDDGDDGDGDDDDARLGLEDNE